MKYTRRNFLRTLFVGVVAVILLPVKKARAKKVALAMASAEPLQKVGGSVLLKIKDQDVLFIRDSETTVRAINPMCTHKKCKVAWKPEAGNLQCKCHKSAFTLDGKVTGGPAPRPLQVFEAALSEDKIILTLPDEDEPKP